MGLRFFLATGESGLCDTNTMLRGGATQSKIGVPGHGVFPGLGWRLFLKLLGTQRLLGTAKGGGLVMSPGSGWGGVGNRA